MSEAAQVLILLLPWSYHWSWEKSSLVSRQASDEPREQPREVEDRSRLLSFLVWFTHTPGSIAPHSYINCASLKMLISPLTHFRLRATIRTSPWLRGLAHDSHASTTPG